MAKVRERYVIDAKGNKTGVLLEFKDYKKILRDLEDLESIRSYDRAKTSGDEAIPFEEAVEEIEKSRK